MRGNRLKRSRNIRVKAAGASRALRLSRTSTSKPAVRNIVKQSGTSPAFVKNIESKWCLIVLRVNIIHLIRLLYHLECKYTKIPQGQFRYGLFVKHIHLV